MTYSLDTSALIDAWRFWYSPESHEGFWEGIEELGSSGVVRVSDQVLEELKAGGDDLYRWVKQREDVLCQPSTREVQVEVGRLVNAYTPFGSSSAGGKDWADPFVIATAKQYQGGMVITHEGVARKGKKKKVPDVCVAESISVAQIHEIVRSQGWTFKRR